MCVYACEHVYVCHLMTLAMSVQDVVDHVMKHLEHEVGVVRLMHQCEPKEVMEQEGGSFRVTWRHSISDQLFEVGHL